MYSIKWALYLALIIFLSILYCPDFGTIGAHRGARLSFSLASTFINPSWFTHEMTEELTRDIATPAFCHRQISRHSGGRPSTK